MKPHIPLHQLLLLFLLIFLPSSATTAHNIPNLSPHRRTVLIGDLDIISSSISEDYETFFFTQTLDHFNYRPASYATFKQRYVVNYKYWGGAKSSAPIFAYLGEEEELDYDVLGIGFLKDNAPHFKALQVYIEHRFYEKSIPFGSMEVAIKNESIRGYFNSAQAIADYIEVLLYLRKKLSAKTSPIIVIGGSYGVMNLNRVKSQHIALGALASSAPILYFDDLTPEDGYYSVVTKDFKETSESCYQTIQKSWSEIDKVASMPNGLSILSKRFKSCSPLNCSSDLKYYLEAIYCVVAQYEDPPSFSVSQICGGIDGASEGTDILDRIFAGVVSLQGNQPCYDVNENNDDSETDVGWGWQTCSEMVMPIGRGSNDTMFPLASLYLKQYSEDCKNIYGVPPRPHWVTTYYGGYNIKLVLHRFASNIIFSNGLRDPYSSGGVLEDISDNVLAVYTVNGSHCLDILPARESDPRWLVMQRKREVEIIEGWIKQYYDDLAFKKSNNMSNN
ncbi:unnamed protein product [Ilex paraguariensis]|uniref:Lysosomal Pro-X carboxypeptidase n=1 Tax=Ilex paraguariensis TaxID=185542 RepID=A0ABC8RZT0_9AQUA